MLVKDAGFLPNLYDPSNPGTVAYSPESLAQHAEESLANFYTTVVGYTYDETLTSYHVDVGSVAMANSGPNTNGSQFFIVSDEAQPHLDGKHTVFGTVVEGMNVVHTIEQGDVITRMYIENPQPVSEVLPAVADPLTNNP
jgi:cyclophilin family peptidyl-prolyl cis-trans isomerase